MAIKLTDIVTVMKAKWIYGDKFFGYTEEFNDNHNTQYPSILITPPTSVFPEVGINNGWENYTFEVYFSDLYNRTAQANEQIDQRWENLQDLATEWLDDFLKNYQDTAPILAFLEDESVTIERNKEVANDQLIQIKMTFTWRVLSKCFRPQSTSPNAIPNLAVWLRADAGTTFSIPTKKVSAWADQSGNSNSVAQTTSADQPKRYTYDGASDKTRLELDGTNDDFISDSNNPISNTELTIFTVAQAEKVTPAFTNTYATRFDLGTDVVDCGNPAGGVGGQLFSFTDGANTDQPFSISLWACIDPTEPWRGWIEKSETPGAEEWSLKCIYGTGEVEFKLTNAITQCWIQARVVTTFPKGEWVHVVATYDGSGTIAGMAIYYNGVSQAIVPQTSVCVYDGMQLTASPLLIGKASNLYKGQLDEVSIFDSALSQADATELYNLGNPSDVITSTPNANLIGWWRMGDGATFPTIPDDSSNNNHGTMDASMSQSNFETFVPTSERGAYYSYIDGNIMITIGSNSGRPYLRFNDSAQLLGEYNVRLNRDEINDTNNYHILTAYLDATDISLQTNNNAAQVAPIDASWGSPTFSNQKFSVGSGTNLGFLNGNIQEVVLYNRALNTSEIEKVKAYLNKKYKIY